MGKCVVFKKKETWHHLSALLSVQHINIIKTKTKKSEHFLNFQNGNC